MSDGYEVLDHPSDLSVRVFGSSLEETFRQATLAMWDLMGMVPISNLAQPLKSRCLELQSHDLESLLVDFLNEQIFLLYSEGFVVNRVGNITTRKVEDGYILLATLEGQKSLELKTSLFREIKAATYHGIKVTPFWAEITFDV